MPRSPEQIQFEIDAARESLASTLDELSYRADPKRLTAQGKAAALAFLQSPPGMALVGAVGLTIAVVVGLKVKHRNDPPPPPLLAPRRRR
ncbi:DUF3618 domain-containing protein [Modestobacter lapidis]|nr:DUF3618 domain-containing protein [Modestobacter lapidis]